MSDYPKHCKKYKNARDFRTKKRLDVRKALKVVEELRLACVYTPASKYIIDAFEKLEQAKELLSVKKWKR